MKQLAEINIGETLFGAGKSYTELEQVSDFVSFFLKLAFTLTGIILMFFLLLGGIGLMSSAGKNNPQGAEQAKKTITSAVIGFVVVFAAYWVVKLIGIIFGIPNLI